MNSGKEPPPPPPPPPLPPTPLQSNDLSPANVFMQQPNQLPMQNNYNSQVGCHDNIDWAGLLSGSINNEPIATLSNVPINPRNIMIEGGEQHQQQLQEQQHGELLCRYKGKFRKMKYVPPRIAFHTRSTEDILDDGYKWKKYGQKAINSLTAPTTSFHLALIVVLKISLNHENISYNHFITNESYYRCTHHTCNVKKQIQRLSKDTRIVVTTYEGIHNHPCEKLMETLSPLLKQLHSKSLKPAVEMLVKHQLES
ncbi:hypothetical protein RND71_042955 [Anisodus tanguticus]|uniref:WRKY domain-containing protein n=1 Tax=Anisodus tanguticus TaxID=243964 RepID=A0AAE1UNG0_9SOLA|nr:hypothetical protein RND71_042955 [Anisodus tanguticus]